MKKKSVNWQDIFSLVRKEALYRSIVSDCLYFDTSAIRDPFDTGYERTIRMTEQ